MRRQASPLDAASDQAADHSRQLKLSGFEVLELLGPRRPSVIFVTAHDEFAIRAFEVHAIDYLLKPVDTARLRAALERAATRASLPVPEPSPQQLSSLARPPGRALERVVIRDGAHIHVLPAEQIDFIQAQDDYLEFAASGKRRASSRLSRRSSRSSTALDSCAFTARFS